MFYMYDKYEVLAAFAYSLFVYFMMKILPKQFRLTILSSILFLFGVYVISFLIFLILTLFLKIFVLF